MKANGPLHQHGQWHWHPGEPRRQGIIGRGQRSLGQHQRREHRALRRRTSGRPRQRPGCLQSKKDKNSPTAPLQSSGTQGNNNLWTLSNNSGKTGAAYVAAGKGLTNSSFYQSLQQWTKPGATPSQQHAAAAARTALETTNIVLTPGGDTPEYRQQASGAQKAYWQAKLTEDKNWAASDPSNAQAQAAVKATQGSLANFDQKPQLSTDPVLTQRLCGFADDQRLRHHTQARKRRTPCSASTAAPPSTSW